MKIKTKEKEKTKILPYFFLIGIITLLAYFQVRSFGFINYDDNHYVSENIQVQGGLSLQGIAWAFTTTQAANWHPLTWIFHMLDIQLFGFNPGAHHLSNLFLHIMNACLLLFFLLRFTPYFWSSLFISFLFALHPQHVESVAWVSEKKDVLSAFFYLWTMISYAFYIEKKKDKSYYFLTLIFLLLALLSKPMAVSLPFTLLLLDIWPLKRTDKNFLERVKEKIPHFTLVFIFCLTTLYAQSKGQAVQSFKYLTMDLRIGNAFTSYLSYLLKMIWPFNLGVFYPHPEAALSWGLSFLSLAALILITVAVFKWGKERPYLFFGWFFYLISLLPVIGIIQVGVQAMADRYSYLPLIGIFIMITYLSRELIEKLKIQKWQVSTCSVALLLGLFILCVRQVSFWSSSVNLFSHTLEVAGPSSVAHHNLAFGLFNEKRVNEALPHYEKSIQMWGESANARNNYGNALAMTGKLDEALKQYEYAFKIDKTSAEALSNMGIVYSMTDSLERATEKFNESLVIRPDNYQALANLAVVYLKKGQAQDALPLLYKALSYAPNNGKVLFIMGKTLSELGRYAEGEEYISRAKSLEQSF